MFLRCSALFLIILSIRCLGERVDIQCGIIEKSDQRLLCEFINVIASQTSEYFVTESNKQIDAVSFRQSSLLRIPSDIFRVFQQLKHLDVELTELKEINANDFENANELRFLLARFNQITTIKSNTFIKCSKLKYIVMQNNRISHIENGALTGLNQLEAIFLDHNQLITLPDDFLKPVVNLVHFSMSNNKLTQVDEFFFMKNEKLETLNLGSNFLTSFNEEQFKKMQHLEQIHFDHNKLKELNLKDCKSTEVVIDKNELEVLELNKWTRIVSAWGNPLKKLILHENYGTGRSYSFSFKSINEITFFVNENCCTVENLENFQTLIQSFGDLSEKRFNVNEWNCKFEKSVEYQTETGRVVNNVCRKITSNDGGLLTFDENLGNFEDENFDYLETTTSIEDIEKSSDSRIFVGSGSFGETKTSTSQINFDTATDTFTARVVEIAANTTELQNNQPKKGIWNWMKQKASAAKSKVVAKWKDFWNGEEE